MDMGRMFTEQEIKQNWKQRPLGAVDLHVHRERARPQRVSSRRRTAAIKSAETVDHWFGLLTSPPTDMA
ncbi:hypothetical protein YDYSG_40340 [Paenibacillus tyrfis]|nr:hypothetical protein YDYSG_40340 [Paenibacillus tyrfis]